MAHATQTPRLPASLMARAAHSVRSRLRRRATYTRTLRELSQMSDQAAADLGLHRSMFPALARQVAAQS